MGVGEERQGAVLTRKRADREGRECELGVLLEKAFDVLLVFLGKNRAGRIDERAARFKIERT